MNFIHKLTAITFGALACCAQEIPQPPPPATTAPTYEVLPFRLEVGGYENYVDNGYGNWRGGDAQLWYRGNSFFVPAFTFDSQTRPAGTQQNYGFLSYLNWTKSFYTVQGFSVAPQHDGIQTIYFPKHRYDVTAYWKLPPKRNLVIGAGFTRFDLGAPGYGEIFSLGAIYYHGKFVFQGTGYVNRNQPGVLYSGSGTLAVQYGQEGKSWLGGNVSGGHLLYRFAGQTPFDVRFYGYSFQGFYRKWLTRHTGIVTTLEYQNQVTAFQRFGANVSLFFEF